MFATHAVEKSSHANGLLNDCSSESIARTKLYRIMGAYDLIRLPFFGLFRHAIQDLTQRRLISPAFISRPTKSSQTCSTVLLKALPVPIFDYEFDACAARLCESQGCFMRRRPPRKRRVALPSLPYYWMCLRSRTYTNCIGDPFQFESQIQCLTVLD